MTGTLSKKTEQLTFDNKITSAEKTLWTNIWDTLEKQRRGGDIAMLDAQVTIEWKKNSMKDLMKDALNPNSDIYKDMMKNKGSSEVAWFLQTMLDAMGYDMRSSKKSDGTMDQHRWPQSAGRLRTYLSDITQRDILGTTQSVAYNYGPADTPRNNPDVLAKNKELLSWVKLNTSHRFHIKAWVDSQQAWPNGQDKIQETYKIMEEIAPLVLNDSELNALKKQTIDTSPPNTYIDDANKKLAFNRAMHAVLTTLSVEDSAIAKANTLEDVKKSLEGHGTNVDHTFSFDVTQGNDTDYATMASDRMSKISLLPTQQSDQEDNWPWSNGSWVTVDVDVNWWIDLEAVHDQDRYDDKIKDQLRDQIQQQKEKTQKIKDAHEEKRKLDARVSTIADDMKNGLTLWDSSLEVRWEQERNHERMVKRVGDNGIDIDLKFGNETEKVTVEMRDVDKDNYESHKIFMKVWNSYVPFPSEFLPDEYKGSIDAWDVRYEEFAKFLSIYAFIITTYIYNKTKQFDISNAEPWWMFNSDDPSGKYIDTSIRDPFNYDYGNLEFTWQRWNFLDYKVIDDDTLNNNDLYYLKSIRPWWTPGIKRFVKFLNKQYNNIHWLNQQDPE